MSQEQNTRLVQDAYAAFQRGDIAAVLNLLTDDVSWLVPGPKDIVPFVGQRLGRDQVKQFSFALAEAQEAEQFDPKQLIAQGNQVVALGHYQWRVKSTGRRHEGDFAHVFTVRDGKISAFHEYTDTYQTVTAYSGGAGQAAAR